MTRYEPTERVGVNAVEQLVLKDLGWIFREQPIVDMGIDAHIEFVDNGQPTGKLIAVQIKSGPSHFRETDDAYVFRGALTHLDYWTNHSLPVILVAHLPESNRTLWVYVDRNEVHRAEKSWTIPIPKTNVLSRQTKNALTALFDGSPSQQRMRKLAIDEPLMRHIRRGGKVSVELEDWINKGLSRSNVEVFVRNKNGRETLAHKWLFYHTGRDMKLLAERIFPWSVASLDEEFYEEYEELYGDDDDGWTMDREHGYGRSSPEPNVIYPYTNDSGEVDRYRLKLKLGKLGKAYLIVSNFAAGLDDK
jgi:hypothetical protein